VLSVAGGLIAAACTDGLLVAAGAGHFAGPPLGLFVAPLLIVLLSRAVRDELRSDVTSALLVFGAAWLAAPFVDQHLTGAVALDGALPDLVHHAAGWLALAPTWRRRITPQPNHLAQGSS
jgi:hypothetical protein